MLEDKSAAAFASVLRSPAIALREINLCGWNCLPRMMTIMLAFLSDECRVLSVAVPVNLFGPEELIGQPLREISDGLSDLIGSSQRTLSSLLFAVLSSGFLFCVIRFV